MTAVPMPGYAPYLIIAGVAFAIYRRVRSHFGWQRWQPGLVMARVVMMALFLAMLLAMLAFRPQQYWGIAVGTVAGALLAMVALRLLRVDVVDGRAGYVPNPWIGGALTALLLGRLAWRFAGGGYANPQATGPLTLSIAAMVIAFYLVQGLGLIRRMKRVTAAG